MVALPLREHLCQRPLPTAAPACWELPSPSSPPPLPSAHSGACLLGAHEGSTEQQHRLAPTHRQARAAPDGDGRSACRLTAPPPGARAQPSLPTPPGAGPRVPQGAARPLGELPMPRGRARAGRSPASCRGEPAPPVAAGRFPVRVWGVLGPTSFFCSTWCSPFSAAIFFTKSLVSPPRGKRVLRRASWGTWLRKKVWSLKLSAACRSFTAAKRKKRDGRQ